METPSEIAIQKILGIEIKDLQGIEFDNLNEIPQGYIDNARKLGKEFDAEFYLSCIVSNDNTRHLKGFVRAVVTNRLDHQLWGKGTFITPDFSLEELLTTKREDLFRLEEFENQYVIKPDDIEGWSENSVRGGSFVFSVPSADYKYKPPLGFVKISVKPLELMKINKDQSELYFRRWIATIIAGYLRFYDQLSPSCDLTVLYKLARKDTWTEDATAALNGLIKEMLFETNNDSKIPGFRGSDAFYMSKPEL